jgi:hypothetical protein
MRKIPYKLLMIGKRSQMAARVKAVADISAAAMYPRTYPDSYFVEPIGSQA